MSETGDNHAPKQLVPYLWKKGVSGNPKGRPPGKTLKEYAREYLLNLPDEEKLDYLASIDPKIVWEMAEGKAKQDIDLKGNLTIAQVINELDGQTTTRQELGNESPIQDSQQSGSDGGIQDESSSGPLQSEQMVSESNTES